MEPIWDEIKAYYFRERFPNGKEDLRRCFKVFARSTYYDGTLDEDTIIDAWEGLCIGGTGHIIITESRALSSFLGGDPIIAVYFSAYITQRYATQITAMTDVRTICMDFLRRYHDFTKHNRGYNPAHTKNSIETEYDERDFRLYYINLFLVLNPKLPPQNKIPSQVISANAAQKQDALKRIFGGFHFHAWFNVVCGETLRDVLLGLGQMQLREQRDNQNVEGNNRYYLMCTTYSQQASSELHIPEAAPCVALPGSWLTSHASTGFPRKLGWSDLQKETAYLLVLGYTQKQITSFLFDVSQEDRKNFDNHYRTLRSRITSIRESFLTLNEELLELSPSDPRKMDVKMDQRQIVDAILANMHEVRPLIVPLYPDPGVERPIEEA